MIELSLLAAATVPFVRFETEDPISLRKITVFGTYQEGHALGLSCFSGSDNLRITFVPKSYYGAPSRRGLFPPNLVYRFKSDSKARSYAWTFRDSLIEFTGVGSIRINRQKARFIDRLRQDSQLALRYERFSNRIETVTFRYSIDQQALEKFLGECASKSVRKYLSEWKAERDEKLQK